MDEIVQRAMEKWPDVPALFHWLRLDGRGQWRLRGDRVSNPNLVTFFNRNYAVDDRGRWFVQNGPQRVFVSLDATPWILRIDGAGIASHTGVSLSATAFYIDEDGHLYATTEAGIGKIDDRDLPRLADDISSLDMDRLALEFHGRSWIIEPVFRADMPTRFGYVPSPVDDGTALSRQP